MSAVNIEPRAVSNDRALLIAKVVDRQQYIDLRGPFGTHSLKHGIQIHSFADHVVPVNERARILRGVPEWAWHQPCFVDGAIVGNLLTN
jgi:hypothetical protein